MTMHWPAYSDTVLALKRLKKQFQLVAATNTQRWGQSCFELTLEMPFDWTVSCDDTRLEQPDPRCFLSLRNLLARRGIRHVDKPARPDWHFTKLRELADAVDAEPLQEHGGGTA